MADEAPSPELFAEMFGPLADIMPPGMMELLSATAYAVMSANEGECAGCGCDVCVSLRAVTLGFDRVMEGL